jgi:CubicO group peptidase (beta-lactamase class C family)
VNYTVNGKSYTFEDYLRQNHVTGFLVLHDNVILVERYLHGATAESRFVSQSISKSIVAVLVGIAIDRHLIDSVNEPVTRYFPELASSGYKTPRSRTCCRWRPASTTARTTRTRRPARPV